MTSARVRKIRTRVYNASTARRDIFLSRLLFVASAVRDSDFKAALCAAVRREIPSLSRRARTPFVSHRFSRVFRRPRLRVAFSSPCAPEPSVKLDCGVGRR